MKRNHLWAIATSGVIIVVVLALLSRSTAEPKKTTPSIETGLRPATTQLPVGQVILYSSGVGFFQREGSVEGNARVDLSFPVSDINDLIKSMVLRDLSGGHVSAVSYDSQAPVERTLQSFAINLHGNPGFGALLQQARGEKVKVTLTQSNAALPGTLTGSLIGVEPKSIKVGKDSAVEVEMLNLWCAEGIRSVPLSDVSRLRFLNPIVESEVRKALETLALSHNTQKKAVSLSFSGEGKREVRVGYVVESPIWKTSYRLVLNQQGKPYLQGWAIVENPTDEDWNGVKLALVSGRPISFQMNLYTPLYVPRPTVQPELFASLQPRTYESDMGRLPLAMPERLADSDGSDFAPKKAASDRFGVEMKESLEKRTGRTVNLPLPAGGMAGFGFDADKNGRIDLGLQLQQGVRNAASASQLGESFQYEIATPVSLSRQKSAMLPIVTKEIEGERVSIYNESTHAKFPLLGLRFKNTSGLHLMQGPITVFEGNTYAGDSRIMDIQPNEERLLSFAVDLGVEVEPVVTEPRTTLKKVKLVKGVMETTTRVIESRTWKIVNRSGQDRTLLIEHPYRQDFRLISEGKPREQARDVYHFEVKVPTGKSASQVVTEEKDLGTEIQLTNTNDEQIKYFLGTGVLSPSVRTALVQVQQLKSVRSATQQNVAHARQQLADIEKDQQRLRANLKETPPTAAAYKKYLEKLDKQETEIDDLTARIKTLDATALRQQHELDQYLTNLNVE